MSKDKDLLLIVDDMPENIDTLYNILKEEYEIKVAKDGKKALGLVKEEIPALILLDIMMPEMDGYEVCEKLKSDSSTNEIPIIFLTSKSLTEDIVKGFKLGAVDYVTKPFNPIELEARVKTHLDLKKSREKLKKQNEELSLINIQVNDKAVLSEEKAGYLAERIKKILSNNQNVNKQIDTVKKLIPLIATNDLGNLKVVMKILDESKDILDEIVKEPNEEYFRILSYAIEPLKTAISDIDSVIQVLLSIGFIDKRSITGINLEKTAFYDHLKGLYDNGKLSYDSFRSFLNLAKFTIANKSDEGYIIF